MTGTARNALAWQRAAKALREIGDPIAAEMADQAEAMAAAEIDATSAGAIRTSKAAVTSAYEHALRALSDAELRERARDLKAAMRAVGKSALCTSALPDLRARYDAVRSEQFRRSL